MQAIQAATQNPAKLFHQDYKLGTLEPNKLADLILLDADPLTDIRNIQKIHMVIKGGEVVDTSYHRHYYPALTELEYVGLSSSSAPVPQISEVITITMNTSSMVINNASPFELVVKGGGFHMTSLVHLSGRPLETTFVNRNELRAQVPTERIRAEGTFPVTVVTPWPGGGTSNTSTLTVK